jgi:protein gp37
MGEETKIEWTDHTFNPWIGCQKVSPGCDHCYAETKNNFRKWNGGTWGPRAPRKLTSKTNWKLPFRWERQAVKAGERRRVFCASLADVFDNKAPEGAREGLFKVIRLTPNLDWLLLTKRPENIRKMLPSDWRNGYENVWLGTTAEDQDWYNHRWSILRTIPAKAWFISYEPALGALDLDGLWSVGRPFPDWIICGGESGGRARYMDPHWAYDLRDQCRRLDVAFFMKQMTKRAPIPIDLLIREFPEPRRLAA